MGVTGSPSCGIDGGCCFVSVREWVGAALLRRALLLPGALGPGGGWEAERGRLVWYVVGLEWVFLGAPPGTSLVGSSCAKIEGCRL